MSDNGTQRPATGEDYCNHFGRRSSMPDNAGEAIKEFARARNLQLTFDKAVVRS